jgi:hypothetical protein
MSQQTKTAPEDAVFVTRAVLLGSGVSLFSLLLNLLLG